METWKWVVGAPGYRVSNLGRVASHHIQGVHTPRWRVTPRIIACHRIPSGENAGYVIATLRVDGVQKLRKVHSLVLEAFVGPCPEGMMACHWNGIRWDNRLDNLRWGTPEENSADTVRLGMSTRGERSPQAKLTEAAVRAIRADTRVQREIAAEYGVCQQIISGIRNRKSWKHVI